MDLTGLGSVADFASGIVNRFFPPDMAPGEKAKKEIELQGILSKREMNMATAQKDIIVAELQQGDNFTKRARPMIIYSGLLFIFLVHVVIPIASWIYTFATLEKITFEALSLPREFWLTWGGVCSVYSWGRSREKSGHKSKLIGLITGNGA